jgi:hypothetical protein
LTSSEGNWFDCDLMTNYAHFNFDNNKLLTVTPTAPDSIRPLHEEFCKAWLVTLKTANMLREMFDEVWAYPELPIMRYSKKSAQ